MTLTPREFAYADLETSEAMGLPAQEHGLLFCEDEHGEHWTAVAPGDPDHLQMLVGDTPRLRHGAITPEAYPFRRRGWPDEWSDEPRGDT